MELYRSKTLPVEVAVERLTSVIFLPTKEAPTTLTLVFESFDETFSLDGKSASHFDYVLNTPYVFVRSLGVQVEGEELDFNLEDPDGVVLGYLKEQFSLTHCH